MMWLVNELHWHPVFPLPLLQSWSSLHHLWKKASLGCYSSRTNWILILLKDLPTNEFVSQVAETGNCPVEWMDSQWNCLHTFTCYQSTGASFSGWNQPQCPKGKQTHSKKSDIIRMTSLLRHRSVAGDGVWCIRFKTICGCFLKPLIKILQF